MSAMPALFVSHGSPMILLDPSPARDFLAGLAATVPRPRAILAVSAHWTTAAPQVSVAARPQTIHDFHGFPPQLYDLRYPAPGDPALAASYVDAFANGLQALGYSGAVIRSLLQADPADLVGIRFTPASGSLQTPGPQAGQALRS